MRELFLKLTPVTILAAILLAGCAPSSDVMTDQVFQKRKYRKGFFINLDKPDNFTASNKSESTVSAPAEQLPVAAAEEVSNQDPVAQVVEAKQEQPVKVDAENSTRSTHATKPESEKSKVKAVGEKVGKIFAWNPVRITSTETAIDMPAPRSDGGGGYFFTGLLLLIIGALVGILARGAGSGIIGLAGWLISLVGLVFIILWLINLL